MKPAVQLGSQNGLPGQRELQRLGYWSASLVMLLVSLFGLAMLLGLFGVSSGALAYLACLLLAPAFVVMMTSIHYQAAPEKRIWSHIGLCFAVIYAILVSIVYYVQLVALRTAGDELLPFVYTPGSVFFAVDMLGYGFMCLATWFTAGVFGTGDRLSAWIRRLFILHGWFVFPTLIFPSLLPSPSAATQGDDGIFGYLALLLWCLVFIPLAYLVARHFRLLKPGGEPLRRDAVSV